MDVFLAFAIPRPEGVLFDDSFVRTAKRVELAESPP